LDTDGLTALGLVPGLSPASPFPGGRRDEYAGWAEVNIPLFSPDMHVPVFYSFEISASGRIEELSPGGESIVPKVGFRWQPIDNQLAFRGEYSQGFIAPTLFNLFGPTRVSNPTVSVGSDSGQVQTFLPTNPNLPPSTSENYTLGVIYSPKQIPGLTLSADWYRVVQEGIAFNPDANSIVANLNANGSASPYASGFRFTDQSQLTTPAPNQITLANFGTLVIPTLPGAMQKTDGLDLSANYRRPTEQMGIFNFWANANVLFGYYFQGGPGQPAHQFAGYYTDPQVAAGYQGTLPDFIIATGLSWEFMGFTASANARYIPEVRDSGTRFPTAGGSPSNDFTVNGKDWIVDSYYTVDMQLAYRFSSKFGPWLRDLRLAVGVNNITDNIAPFIAS
jgi:iron complex outermembrane receptor protein